MTPPTPITLAELALVRIDASNFNAFMDIVEPLDDGEGCDSFPPPDTQAVEHFLAANKRLTMPALGTARAQMDTDGALIGERRFFHAGPVPLTPMLTPPRDEQGGPLLPLAEARFHTFEQSLRHLVAADIGSNGSLYLRLAEMTDYNGEQLAVFYRPSKASPWAVVHAYAKPEADYIGELLEHPPIEGHTLLRLDRWQDQSLTFTRRFVFEGTVYALPMMHVDKNGVAHQGFIPEHRFVDKAVPESDWLKASEAAHGRLVRSVAPDEIEMETLLQSQPGRFTIIKYGSDRQQILGRAVPGVNVMAELSADAWQATAAAHSRTAEAALCLIPVLAETMPDLRRLLMTASRIGGTNYLSETMLAQFRQDWPGLTPLVPATGSPETRQMWSAAPYSLDGALGADTPVTPSATIAVVQQSIESFVAESGQITLVCRDKPLPWMGLLVLYRPSLSSRTSAALLLNSASQPPLSAPSYQLFGDSVKGAAFLKENEFLQRCMAALTTARPQTAAASQPRRMGRSPLP